MKTRLLVPPLTPGVAGDAGMIGHGSMTWMVARERLVYVGGLVAILLQIAHPKVAAGVAEHSSFHEDPLARLVGTLETILVITFGDRQQYQAMAAQVADLHRPVHGTVNGRPYSALSPELSLWVYATLVEVALDMYSLLFRPLTWAERAQYYEDTRPFAHAFRVSDEVLPPTYAQFRHYYARMLAEEIVVSDAARSIARAIFQAKFHGVPVSPVGPVLAAALLPEQLRVGYELPWDRRTQIAWTVLRQLLRTVAHCTPPRLRQWEHYRVALRRINHT